MWEGVLLVLLSCQDLMRPHRRAVMMECARRRSGCRLPWTWVAQRRACTSRASPLMRAQRTRRWLISRTISPGAWNGDVTSVLGATKRGARTRKCSRVGAAALRGFAAQIIILGGILLEGRHKDVCGVLGKWRQQVVKDGMSPDVLRADLLAFLRQ